MNTAVQHKGSCHCKKVTFGIHHSPHLELSECNCSICAMKGFQGFVIEKSALTSLEGRENLCRNGHRAAHVLQIVRHLALDSPAELSRGLQYQL